MSNITMKAVTSSNVAMIGHHHGDVLRVEFKNGGIYDYIGVTEPMFDKILGAESVGRAVNQLGIKGNRVEE
jgi:hypothetical protein